MLRFTPSLIDINDETTRAEIEAFETEKRAQIAKKDDQQVKTPEKQQSVAERIVPMSASTVKRKDDNSASVSASSEPELNSEEVRQAIEARKSRSGRGKRMHFLLENAKLEQEGDADEEFWNQDYFAEENNDDHYSTEEEVQDIVDDDFSDSEPDDNDDGEASDEARKDMRVQQREERKRKNTYVDPKAKKMRKRGRPRSNSVEVESVDFSHLPENWRHLCENAAKWKVYRLKQFSVTHNLPILTNKAALVAGVQSLLVELHKSGKPLPTMPEVINRSFKRNIGVSVRNSTKKKTIHTQFCIDERQEEHKARRAKRNTKIRVKKPPPTQEQKLLEAKETEQRNTIELNRLIAKHDDLRRQQQIRTRKYRIAGDVIRFTSNSSGNRLAYTSPPEDLFPPNEWEHTVNFNSDSSGHSRRTRRSPLITVLASTPHDKPLKPPPKPLCAHSGLPAKYVTTGGVPFASAADYKAIVLRESAAHEQALNAKYTMLATLLQQAREKAAEQVKAEAAATLPESVAKPTPMLLDDNAAQTRSASKTTQ